MAPKTIIDKPLDTAIGTAVVAGCASPFVFAVLVVLSLPILLYVGLVLRYFWVWFAPPFTSAPTPSFFTMAGVAAAVRMLTLKAERRDLTSDEAAVKYSLIHRLSQQAAGVTLFWLVGYVLHMLSIWCA